MFQKLKGPNRKYKEALPGMKDHQMLAHASRRSGNSKGEGHMYYNQGINFSPNHFYPKIIFINHNYYLFINSYHTFIIIIIIILVTIFG